MSSVGSLPRLHFLRSFEGISVGFRVPGRQDFRCVEEDSHAAKPPLRTNDGPADAVSHSSGPGLDLNLSTRYPSIRHRISLHTMI